MYKVVAVPGRSGRIRLGSFICSALLAMMQLSAFAAGSVTLAWNPSTDPIVAGYNIYYGGASATYTNEIPVGNATNVTISGLVPGATYYFAATTYSAAGVESAFSSEVSCLVPLNVPTGNQPPTLNTIGNLVINENAGLQTVSLSGITSGSTNENQTLTVTAASGNTNLIPNPTVNYSSANTTGSLTFAPVTNANGTVTITVTVNDGGASNNIVTQTFTVTVNAVNQAPTLNALGNLTINENAGLQTVNLSGITSGAANENQTLAVTALSGNTNLVPNPTVNYSSANTTGSLTFAPVTNAYGATTITVKVNDGGTSNNIIARTFTVTVNAVSQPPTLNDISNLTLNVNATMQMVNLSGINPGVTNKNQKLTVTAASSNPALIPTPRVRCTSPYTTGCLTFTPKRNATGTATVTVTLNNGQAQNNIASRTFTVTVTAPCPLLENQLTNLVVLAGQTETFRIKATGKGTLKYQWKCNDTNLPARVSSLLTLKNITTNQSGIYSVTVTDLYGSTNSTANMTVYATPTAKLAPTVSAGGQYAMTVVGVTGFKYVVEASTNLVNWVPVHTNTAPFTFVDPNAGQFDHRFYRTVYAP
jgi:hypothetical protein